MFVYCIDLGPAFIVHFFLNWHFIKIIPGCSKGSGESDSRQQIPVRVFKVSDNMKKFLVVAEEADVVQRDFLVGFQDWHRPHLEDLAPLSSV